MFCSHDPAVDPRIDWQAAGAVRRGFAVTVVGFGAPGTATVNGYRIIRVAMHLDLGVALRHPSLVLLPALLAPLALALRPWRKKFIRFHRFFGLLKFFAKTNTSLLAATPGLKADLWQSHDLETLAAGLLARRRFGGALVYDAHELWPQQHVGAPRYQVALFSALESLLIRRVDRAFTVNHLLAEEMRRIYRLDRAPGALPNCPPLEAFPAREAPPGGKRRFLYLGAFAPGRGLEALVRAWAAAPSPPGVLFLRGPESETRAACRDLAASLGVLDVSVFFPPAVSEDRLVECASQADVGIIPYEPVNINNRLCCPNKLGQYLQAGLAILTNDLPYVREIVARAGCGAAYDSRDPDSFARAVEALDLEPMQENACRFARESYCWEKVSEPLYAAYSELAHGRVQPRDEAPVMKPLVVD